MERVGLHQPCGRLGLAACRRPRVVGNRPAAQRSRPLARAGAARRHSEQSGRLPLRRHHRGRGRPARAPPLHRDPRAVRHGATRCARCSPTSLANAEVARAADSRDDGHRPVRAAGARHQRARRRRAGADAHRGARRAARPDRQGAQRAGLRAAAAAQPVLHARQLRRRRRPRAGRVDAVRDPLDRSDHHEGALHAPPGAARTPAFCTTARRSGG